MLTGYSRDVDEQYVDWVAKRMKIQK
ncbi:hypothetical protein CEXT_793671, partial [Caerostris extrusa]